MPSTFSTLRAYEISAHFDSFGHMPQIKAALKNKNALFNVDLALLRIRGSTQQTNHGLLNQAIIEEKASLFVSAIGMPPKYVVDKLHKAGIVAMNMVGHWSDLSEVTAATSSGPEAMFMPFHPSVWVGRAEQTTYWLSSQG
ncbi:hypothetical protein APHAL10511_007482 [Amanita phalloides]|nr:hypothetical protein APHAL10511_007482 [Amanita phalloides]